MKTLANHYSWPIAAAVFASILILPGCLRPCAWWRIQMEVASDESLYVDGSTLATGEASLALEVRALHTSGQTDTRTTALVPIGDDNFVLGQPTTMTWLGVGHQEEVVPAAFNLFFGLIGVAVGDTAETGFSTIESQGDSSSVELWDGYTLQLLWDESYAYCK